MNYFFSFTDLANPTSPLHQLSPPARLAILGATRAHSRSPAIHNARIKELGLPWRYVSITVKPEELEPAFHLLKKYHFIGFNITIPYKKEAFRLVNKMTEHACLLGAINTVTIHNGKFYGSNTDGPGFVAALQEEWNFSLQNKSVLLLGASGGAGCALTMQCALEKCRHLFLSSRTPEILQPQVQQLLKIRPDLLIQTIDLDKASLQQAMSHVNLVVNATSVGFFDSNISSLIPTKFFQPQHYLYDIVYAEKPTPLIEAAKFAGAHAVDGSSMLRLQGALSFETWLHSKTS